MKRITDYKDVSPLVMKYFKRGVITNNFLCAKDYKCEIAEGRLFYRADEDSLCFFVERDGFFRLYFHALSQDAEFPQTKERLVCELVADEDRLMRSNGFLPILQRTRLERVSLKAETAGNRATKEDAREILELMQSCFDETTGCIPTLTRIRADCENESIYRVTRGQKTAGILRTETVGKAICIKHLCVSESFRGEGIGRELCAMASGENRKVFVWTGKENTAALNLYRSCGFKESGIESTVYERK